MLSLTSAIREESRDPDNRENARFRIRDGMI